MIMKVDEGTIILKENEVNMDMYRIQSGHVELYKGYGTKQETLLGILAPEAYFGEIGLLTQKPSIYTVVAYEAVELLRIPVDDIGRYIEKHPEDAVSIMKNMANTMYNLKFDIDLLSKERMIDVDMLAKRLLKYNLNMFAKARREDRRNV